MRAFFYFIQLLIALLFIFYAVRLGKETQQWLAFSSKTCAELVETKVQGEKKFYIEGKFRLPDGKLVDVLLKGPFRNRYIAEEEMKSLKDKEYDLWVHNDKALFKKRLPLKSLVTSLLLAALFIYFGRLRTKYYV